MDDGGSRCSTGIYTKHVAGGVASSEIVKRSDRRYR